MRFVFLVHLHVKIAQALVICPWLHAGSDTSIVVTLMGLPEYLARERFLHSMYHQERLALVYVELLPQPPTSRAIRIGPIQRWHPQPIAALASPSSPGWKLPCPFVPFATGAADPRPPQSRSFILGSADV
ncbi:protein of unknown function [Methylorubrum extorquens DM4]|uniref:Uncharacterized protein n=1 Tax=Methylorubrum extorquens (strain DSM 6343 / CIP 106787 / DM4) TaxID=661410 RepID=C7CHL4_METED|nr:protein of unknown function [Methylorubrum extorquens DM4]